MTGNGATLHIYADDHDGAFYTPWGDAEQLIISLADWLRACQRLHEAPTAVGYHTWCQDQSTFSSQFAEACNMTGELPGSTGLRFSINTTGTGTTWIGQLDVWRRSDSPDAPWTPWIAEPLSGLDLTRIHRLAAFAASQCLSVARSFGRPDLTAEAEWETVRADHWAAAEASFVGN